MSGVMPDAPPRMVWVLEIDPLRDEALLWLYMRSRLTGRSNGSCVQCTGVLKAHSTYERLSVLGATIDELVEAVVVAADKLRDEQAAVPVRREQQRKRAELLSQRLGIKVRFRP